MKHPLIKLFAILMILLTGTWLALVYFSLPDVSILKNKNPKTTSFIEMRRQQARAQKKSWRLRQRWVRYAEIPKLLKQSVRISEDAAFFQHRGVDYTELEASLKRNWKEGRISRGGSTITQQLAKNLYLSSEKTLLRKFKEYLIARRLEKKLSKYRIFHLYLNLIEFGPGIFGVEAASRYCFGRHVRDLNLEQIIRLTAIIPRPLSDRPTSNSRWLLWKCNWILEKMKTYGYIGVDQYQRVKPAFNHSTGANMKHIEELIEKGNFKAALEALMREEKTSEVNYLLGLIYTRQDSYDLAIKHLENAQKQNPDDYRIPELLGEAYGLKAQHAGVLKSTMLLPKVKKAFNRALELNPQALRAREGLFMLYLFIPSVAGGDELKARELAAEIATLNPAHGSLALGIIAAKESKTEQAITLFEEAAALEPEDSEIQLKAGRFFLQNNKLDLAQNAFERLVLHKPFDPAGYDALGTVLLGKNQPEKALEHLNIAVEKNENFFPARLNRARVFAALQQTDAARKDAQYVLDVQPRSPLATEARQLLAEL